MRPGQSQDGNENPSDDGTKPWERQEKHVGPQLLRTVSCGWECSFVHTAVVPLCFLRILLCLSVCHRLQEAPKVKSATGQECKRSQGEGPTETVPRSRNAPVLAAAPRGPGGSRVGAGLGWFPVKDVLPCVVKAEGAGAEDSGQEGVTGKWTWVSKRPMGQTARPCERSHSPIPPVGAEGLGEARGRGRCDAPC